mgnify:CR=1 FL=1
MIKIFRFVCSFAWHYVLFVCGVDLKVNMVKTINRYYCVIYSDKSEMSWTSPISESNSTKDLTLSYDSGVSTEFAVNIST